MKKARMILAFLLIAVLSACAADTVASGNRVDSDGRPESREESRTELVPEVPNRDLMPREDEGTSGTAYSRYAGDHELAGSPGVLTAGRWNDNENWDDFQDVLSRYEWMEYQESWGLYPGDRIGVFVSLENKPAVGAEVSVYDRNSELLWKAVTDNHGAAYVYPSLLGDLRRPAYVEADYAGQTERCTVQSSGGYVHLEFDGQQTQTRATDPALDLMLVMDTTGSMGDELDYLTVELEDVVRRTLQAHEDLRIRTSVNFYRDTGDKYITLNNRFTTDLDESLAQMREQEADGGGDEPEAGDQALSEAVKEHSWESPTRLLFWVLDAPPHNRGDNYRLKNALVRAAADGIRIIPVASSGVDEETEYLLRTMAAATGGQYVFLTDDSGVGNEHEEPTIPDYETQYLNDLLVDVISEYLRSYPTVAG